MSDFAKENLDNLFRHASRDLQETMLFAIIHFPKKKKYVGDLLKVSPKNLQGKIVLPKNLMNNNLTFPI